MNSHLVSPEDEGSHVDSFGVFIIASLHEGFTYVEMFPLNNSVGLGVIRGNPDVMDAIFL